MSSASLSSDDNPVLFDVSAHSVIPVQAQLPNLRSADEDWTGVTAQARRRRLQNRINQRTRRQKLKKEEDKRLAVVEEPPRNASASPRILPARAYLLGRPENRELLAQFAALAENYLGTPNLVHLEDTVRCNVFLALAHNIKLLGFDDRWLTYDAISPFSSFGPQPVSTLDVPANMRPTALQLAVEHHPWIDLMPCPRMRDNFLQFVHVHGEDAVDEDDLCRDYVDAAGSERGTESGAAVIAWSDPWSPNGWEVTAGFVKKWGWLLHGCVELQAGTNAWRTRRGLPRLLFPGC
ncbi:hypothetical protein F5883DRAFT_535516 [Diaporthe sp. PMI_573]|jgi:hypothetical protein|nr:hypothetical protein F5883DRAFT_535516 [Diaporthaceae sp. PMI_573]